MGISHHKLSEPGNLRSVYNLIEVAKAICGAEVACLWLKQGNTIRHVASMGLQHEQAFFVRKWETGFGVPEKPTFSGMTERIFISRTARHIYGPVITGRYTRIPLQSSSDCVFGLTLFTADREATMPKPMVQLLKQVVKAMAADTKATFELLMQQQSPVSILADFTTLANEVALHPGKRFLLTTDLRVITASKSAAQILGSTQGRVENARLSDLFFPAFPTFEMLCRKVLSTGCSSPEIDISADADGFRYSGLVRFTPARPLGHSEDILHVTCVEDAMTALETSIGLGARGSEGKPKSGDVTTEAFLCQTMLRKRALRNKGDVSFITLRTWNKGIRAYQEKALEAVKRASSRKLAFEAARECAREITGLVGANAFKFIVPMPDQLVKWESDGLSHLLAVALGAELGLPVIEAFSFRRQPEAAGPNAPHKRPKLRMVQDVPGPAILIDDLAINGHHFEEAAHALNANGTPCFAMAWIGSEAA